MAYPFEAYDEHACLKPSLAMLLTLLYSVRHLLFVFLLYFPLIMGAVDLLPLKRLMSTSLASALALAEGPALLLLIAWRYRQPQAATFWRWLWRHGRTLLLLTLTVQALLLAWGFWTRLPSPGGA